MIWTTLFDMKPVVPDPESYIPPGDAPSLGVSAGSDLPTMLEPMPAPTGVPPGAKGGVPGPLFVAPILGSTPTSIQQILLAPFGSNRPSRVTGPMMSGPKGGLAVGSALLALPLWVDYSMGSFNLPIQFPPGSILLWIQMTTYAAWGGGAQNTAVSLGTASGRTDIFGPDGFPAQHVMELLPMTGTLPFATDPNPWQCWVGVNGYSNTSGAGFLSLLYASF